MTQKLPSGRTAVVTLAAILAFTTSPALAQPAPADTPPELAQSAPSPEPAPAPEPTVALPSLPVQPAPPAEVVQPLPASPPAAPATAAPAVTPRAVPVASAKAAAAQPAPAQAMQAASKPAAPAAASAMPDDVEKVVLSPVPQRAPSPAPEALADKATDVDSGNPAVWWALGGAGLLFAGGLGALAFGRKKAQPVSARAVDTGDRAPATASATYAAPIAAAEPAARVAPVSFQPGVARTAAVNPHWAELEDMVAMRPSAENPFLTRRKRMRRASYILAHGTPEPLHGDMQQPVAAPERATQTQFKPQPAYDFSKAQYPQRFGWKPATS